MKGSKPRASVQSVFPDTKVSSRSSSSSSSSSDFSEPSLSSLVDSIDLSETPSYDKYSHHKRHSGAHGAPDLLRSSLDSRLTTCISSGSISEKHSRHHKSEQYKPDQIRSIGRTEGSSRVVKKYKGAVYRGEIRDGKRNGMGVLEYDSGDMYEGEFYMNQFHGKGTYYWGTLDEKYIGEWFQGEKNGHGTHYYINGDYYEGEWKNNVMHGKGKFHKLHSYVKEAIWSEGVCSSLVLIKFANRERYEGDTNGTKKEGFGTYTYSDGRVYEGNWVEDRKEGLGIMTYSTGQRYEGQFKKNLRHGFGRWYYKNGDYYEGQFRDDMKHGVGKYVYKDGAVEEYDFEYGRTVRGSPNSNLDSERPSKAARS